jgi:RNA polymerase sigma-70 factor (ECF subfamily)
VDQAAFHAFFKSSAPALKGYLRLRCRDAALADDLLQETYLRLLRRPLPTLGAAQLKSYLYKTASSVCVDHYRSRRQEARWREETSTADGTAGADSDDPSGLADGSAPDSLELPVDMQRVFATLKPRQQSLLWLAYVEGFTHDEIAEVIGVNVGSVKVLLSRARALLAEKLNDLGLAPTRCAG